MLAYIVQGSILGFGAAVQPGPFIAYLITQTLAQGWKRSWVAAFAPLLSDGPIILLTLLVLSQVPAWLQCGLNFLSGLFILYLAWGAFRQWQEKTSVDTTPVDVGSSSLLKAALMNLINPSPYIYWSLVTGPILVAGWRQNPPYGLGFLVTFYVVLIGGLLAIMALFGGARQLGEKVSHTLLGISALALTGFGLFQLWRAVLA